MSNLLSSLSLPVRVSLGVIGGGVLAFLTHHFFGTTGMVILLVGAVVVGLLLLAYALILRHLRRRQAASFTSSVQNQSAAAPSSVSRAEEIAKLDDLRRKFEEGVETFRRAGKDFYSLPWYLLAGEPGSGKTEAVRRSGIGFPPGIQDRLQGVGGTINMNWWFTNNAVILDLAGRLLFAETKTGGGAEWDAFLRLLKKHRPNCPINGLLLVIPADSLVRDAPEAMQRKAQWISDQINRVQRTLDVRFPVFVVVTKCDLVTGFRETFEALRSPEDQQQMVGWSNPEAIDVPFRTELTKTYLATVVQRLMLNRQHMLRDPIPKRDLSDARLDEVDALFDLPANFGRLAGALQQYLQSIFVPTEWAAKPPFLRGIYFTSSMQEGKALDLALAKALALPVENLPEGGMFERERALFLRDMFMDKVFQEHGLVTRASNVQRQYRRRKIALLTASAAAILLLLALTCAGFRSLDTRIGRERDLWQCAALQIQAGRDLAVIAPRAGMPGVADYLGAVPVRLPDNRPITLAGLQGRLAEAVHSPLRVPAIFRLTRPLNSRIEAQRRQAQRTAFEDGVLLPVVSCVRTQMLAVAGGAWPPAATAALAALVRIQADASGLEYDPKDRLTTPADLDALFRFALSPDDYATYVERDRLAFDNALHVCYDAAHGGAVWPPASLARGGSLASDPALAHGVAGFAAHCIVTGGCTTQQVQQIQELWADVLRLRRNNGRQCREAEAALVALLTDNRSRLTSLQGLDELAEPWRVRYDAYSNAVVDLQHAASDVHARFERIPLVQGGNIATNSQIVLARWADQSWGVFAGLPLPRQPAACQTNVTLVADVQTAMSNAVVQLHADMAGLTRDLPEFVNDCTSLVCQASEASARLPHLAPLDMPARLRIGLMPWKDLHARFRNLDVTTAHGDIESVARRIEALGGQVPGEDFAAAAARARAAQAKIGSQAFKLGVEGVIGNWRNLPDDVRGAREKLLGMKPDEFRRDFIVGAFEPSDDFATLFWQDVARTALAALTAETKPEIERRWREMQPMARFPLVLPRATGGAEDELPPEQVAEAVRLVREFDKDFGPRTSGGATLGEGASTGVRWIDEPLAALRCPQSSDVLVWAHAACRVADALPPEKEKASTCSIAVASPARQEVLMRECGRDPRDGAGHVWRYVSFTQKGAAGTPVRIEQSGDVKLADAVFPGPPLALGFYEFWGETQERKAPDQEVVCFAGSVWAVPRLLHDPLAKRSPDSKSTWFVPLRIPHKDQEALLWLQLEFGRDLDLPAHDQWPKAPAGRP